MTVCSEARREAISADLDEALAPAERAELAAHLAGCAGCAAEREALEQVARQVRGLSRVPVPAHFTAQVMARVLEHEAGVDPGRRDGCPPAEDLSAALDDALGLEAGSALAEHVAACAACREDQAALSRTAGLVRGLPRIAPPADFAGRVLERIAGDDRCAAERVRAAQARQALWRSRAGAFARAACLLFLVGAGAYLTTPESDTFGLAFADRGWSGGRAPAAAPRSPAREASEAEAKAAADEALALPELPPGPYAATLALGVEDVRAARGRVDGLLRRLGRVEGAWGDDLYQGYVVSVPANRVDDLLAALEAAGVEVDADAAAAAARAHSEQDRVVLESGHAYAGRADEGRGLVAVRTGAGPPLELDRDDVDRIERASDPRRLRLELRAR